MSMSVVRSGRTPIRLLSLDEKLAIALEVERRQSAHLLTTKASRLPMRRWRKHVEIGGGVALGIVSGAIGSLACFILFCMFLHVALF